jgi:hypothetical protein
MGRRGWHTLPTEAPCAQDSAPRKGRAAARMPGHGNAGNRPKNAPWGTRRRRKWTCGVIKTTPREAGALLSCGPAGVLQLRLGQLHRTRTRNRLGRGRRVHGARRLRRAAKIRLHLRGRCQTGLRPREPRQRARLRQGCATGRRAGRGDPGVRAQGVGLDGAHPRLRTPGRRIPRAVAQDLAGRSGAGKGDLRGRHRTSLRAVPWHDRGRPRRTGAPLHRAPLALRRQHGHQAPSRGDDALPAHRRGGGAIFGRRHPLGAGRRRGLRDGHRDRDGRLVAPLGPARFPHRRPPLPCTARRAAAGRGHRLPRLDGRGARPDGGDQAGGPGDDGAPRRGPRPLAGGGIRPVALCSVAVDLRIHEVVDAPNWVVGAFLPDDIFTEGGNG